jgi:CcmD family protein
MRLSILLAGLLLFWQGAPALAADQAKEPPAAGDSGWQDADLRPMQGKGEGFQSTTLITVGYAFIWVMVAGFVVTVWARSRRLSREIEELERRIEAAGKR